ncbi:MAG: NAD(P)/FAD-dependent oxidoreductase [Acidimicrobiia bacterium]|nr:NAD(P)/FAD-dependent oxidoreductase [Acidimicrobiia bacterium]
MSDISEVVFPDEVDGVFVGGGHNALICAGYLARAGLRVLVLEAAPHIGGGTTTDEVTLPLFKHNLHAYFVRWTPEYAVWRDLGLERFGVRSIFPEVQNALPFEGGSRALVTYRDLDRSIASIGRLSGKDAERYRRLHEEFTELVERIDTPLRFSPPLPPDELKERLGRSRLGKRYLELDRQSPLEVVREAFESEPLRSLILFNVAVRGYLPNLDVEGIGSIVALALSNSHQGRLIEGGTYQVARAIAAAVVAAGGMVVTGARVASIGVSNGRATGVELVDGRRIDAGRFVVSSVPAPITMLELVGGEHLDPGLRADLASYRWLEEALFGVHWALATRPVFVAENDNPDVPRALNLALGYESSDDLVAHMEAIRVGHNSPQGHIHSSIPTMHDPSQAPAGHHTTFGWHFVPGPGLRGKWTPAAVRDRVEAMVRTYVRYAPNMEAATMAISSHSPDATERRVISMRGGDRHHGSFHPSNWGYSRPTAEMPGYRTPIEGLYLCGASQHPGGSFHGQPGYNAAGVVAEDVGVERWWGPGNALVSLEALEQV